MVTSTDAVAPASTVRLVDAKVTVGASAANAGAKVESALSAAGRWEKEYVTVSEPRFATVNVNVFAVVPSPTANSLGVTVVVARIASSTSSIPAPCRWTTSRDATTGDGTGSAVFCSAILIAAGVAPGWASRNSAAAPATCGDAIDVPLLTPYAPCSSGSVDRINPPGAPR